MKSFQTAALMIGGSLLLGSCSSLPFFGGNESPPEAEAPAAVAPVAEAPAAEEAALEEVPAPEFTDPLVEDGNTSPVGSLRKATDPDDRLKVAQSRQGRPDPFAANPITVTVELPPPSAVPTTPTVPNLPGVPTLPGTPIGNLPDQPLIPAVILPDPALAKAIVVTGVVQVGSSPQAILRSPLEPSSRYVSPGQRVANGQVLVKRIEVRGSDPVVILEESGIEVVKFVGQPAEVTQPTTEQGGNAA
ncbi:MAG: hypothetical protein ACO3EZ_10725 [Prochlorotrichaceae cyanobacterium]